VLIADRPDLAEVEVNPLRAAERGLAVLDAVVAPA